MRPRVCGVLCGVLRVSFVAFVAQNAAFVSVFLIFPIIPNRQKRICSRLTPLTGGRERFRPGLLVAKETTKTTFCCPLLSLLSFSRSGRGGVTAREDTRPPKMDATKRVPPEPDATGLRRVGTRALPKWTRRGLDYWADSSSRRSFSAANASARCLLPAVASAVSSVFTWTRTV